MWISKSDYHRALLGAKNDGRREVLQEEREREYTRSLAGPHWIPRSSVDWLATEPGRALEAIRAETARSRDEAHRAIAAANRERDEAIAAAEARAAEAIAAADARDGVANAREVDAAYQTGYAEGFTAGRRRLRGTPTP